MILITADLHFSDHPRDDYRHKFQRQLRAIARKHQVTCTLVLGDLCEQKDFHSAALVNTVVGHFYRLAQIAPIIVVRGNHDYRGNPNSPFFAFLSRIECIGWISAPTLASDPLNVPTAALAGLQALFLPHTTNPGRDWADLDLDQPWVFTHNTFSGADGGDGRKLAGIDPPFPKRTKIVSGDVHIPQTVGQVTYVGAPYTVDFGDSYEPRVLLLDRERLHSVACPGPQKRLVEVGDPRELDRCAGLNPGDIFKVRLRLAAADYARWPELRDQVYQWGEAQNLVVHQVQPVVAPALRSPASRTGVVAPKTDEELLAAYARSRGLDAATVKTGLNLLREQ